MAAETTTIERSIPAEVVDYLHLHHIVTLSTSSFTGMPHADTVVYSSDEHRIFFCAGQGSQMLRNITDSRRVSFTIDDYTVDWRKLRELQGIGRCLPATAEEASAAWSCYEAKFGAGALRPTGVLCSLVPIEMHFVDYDYALVAGQPPEIRSQVIAIDSAPPPPAEPAVSTSLERSVYQPGEVVFRPGSSRGEYYVVVEGEVEIRSEGYGADQTVIRLGPGKFFGDQAALRGQHGALTCHAVRPTVLLTVDRATVRDLLPAPT